MNWVLDPKAYSIGNRGGPPTVLGTISLLWSVGVTKTGGEIGEGQDELLNAAACWLAWRLRMYDDGGWVSSEGSYTYAVDDAIRKLGLEVVARWEVSR